MGAACLVGEVAVALVVAAVVVATGSTWGGGAGHPTAHRPSNKTVVLVRLVVCMAMGLQKRAQMVCKVQANRMVVLQQQRQVVVRGWSLAARPPTQGSKRALQLK